MSPQNCLFTAHKSRILAEISSPNPDASPKGSVDVQILPLINQLNQHDRVFTTSSCSGRISVFYEGLKKSAKSSYSGENQQESGIPEARNAVGKAGIGGKGEGGKWLFVSHDPLDVGQKSDREVTEMLLGKEVDEIAVRTSGDGERLGALGLGSNDIVDFDISSTTRFVHLKFEPMVCVIFPQCLGMSNRLIIDTKDSACPNFRSPNSSCYPHRSAVCRFPRIGDNESWSWSFFVPYGCNTLQWPFYGLDRRHIGRFQWAD